MLKKYILDSVTKKVIEEPRLLVWAQWFETADRIVEQTTISEDVTVSTVFLGMDHQFGDGPPLLFETLIFGGEHDGNMQRYSTWPQAKEGHARVVKEERGYK